MEVLEIVAGIIVSLGGGAAIVGGCSNWLGKLWADRLMEKEKSQYARELERLKSSMLLDAESYKVKLKKSEFIFQKEYEAASEFVAATRRLLPEHKHFLEQNNEWLDDFDKLEQRNTDIEIAIGGFLRNHGAILEEHVKVELDSCIKQAIELRYSGDVLGDPFARL